MSAGYSGTPLVRKLGFKPSMRVAFVDAPDHYAALLGDLPQPISILKRPSQNMDLVHFFTRRSRALERKLPALKATLAPHGMLWISWPKKSSTLSTEVAEADVRRAGLEIGLVDIKICAVDEDWSGLKFVYRKEDRW
jgi:hypothetical protein